jgi:hypothetical protein
LDDSLRGEHRRILVVQVQARRNKFMPDFRAKVALEALKGDKSIAEAGAAISMDGAERTIDNVFIERLWRTFKCDNIYLNPADNGTTWLCRYQRVSQLLQLGPVAQFT